MNNTVKKGDGGALHVSISQGNITIEDSNLSYNKALQKGGAIHSSQVEGNYKIINSTFAFNSVQHQGGSINAIFVNIIKYKLKYNNFIIKIE